MKRIVLLCALLVLCAQAQAQVVYPWLLLKDGYHKFYLNPDGIPSDYAAADPRMRGLVGEERSKMQISIYEERLLKDVQKWNATPDATVHLAYLGITKVPCGLKDGISSVCFSSNQAFFQSEEGLASGAVAFSHQYSPTEGLTAPERDVYLNTLNFVYVETTNTHELGHILGFGHESTLSSIMRIRTTILDPQQLDLEALQKVYPFPRECAPEITSVDGQLRMTVQLYIDGVLTRETLETSGSVLRSVHVYENPYTPRFCGVKPHPNGIIKFPLVVMGGQYFYLTLRIAGSVFDIVDYGPAL